MNSDMLIKQLEQSLATAKKLKEQTDRMEQYVNVLKRANVPLKNIASIAPATKVHRLLSTHDRLEAEYSQLIMRNKKTNANIKRIATLEHAMQEIEAELEKEHPMVVEAHRQTYGLI